MQLPGWVSPGDRKIDPLSLSHPSPALLPCSSSFFLLFLPSLPTRACISQDKAGDVLEDVKTVLYPCTSSVKVVFILCTCQHSSASYRTLLSRLISFLSHRGLGLSGENLFMHLTGQESAHSKLSSGLVAQKNPHTVLHPPPVLLPFTVFLPNLSMFFSHISACPVPGCQAAPGGRGGCVGLAWEEILGGPRELALGGCKGRSTLGLQEHWKLIVDVGVKQAQTQEAKCVHRGMRRGGVCDCTALFFFVVLGKVVQALFKTPLPFSYLFGDARLLERCIIFSDLSWVFYMASLDCGCSQLDPCHCPSCLSTPFAGEAQSHLEHGCVSAEHPSELLCQRILCCLLPQIKFQCLRSMGEK